MEGKKITLEERRLAIEEKKLALAEKKFSLEDFERRKNLEFLEEQRKDLNRTLERQDNIIQMLLQQIEIKK